MTPFTELMASIARADEGWSVTVSDDWLQGRTLYGGLAAALCLQAAQRELPDLPPLRSAQFSFVGPASGQLQIRATLLRRGKSAAFVGVDLVGEAGLATRAILCFGAARDSAHRYSALATPDVPRPETLPNFFRNAPALNFLQHFEGKLAGGSKPFSGAGDPVLLLWLRHRDAALTPSMVSLLALADAPPPPAVVRFDTFAPISTMTWSIDVLSEDVATDDGWWLISSIADNVAGGYSSQAMTVWNAAGTPVMASRQNVAIFA
jgi:acyl-CoA thioesterase